MGLIRVWYSIRPTSSLIDRISGLPLKTIGLRPSVYRYVLFIVWGTQTLRFASVGKAVFWETAIEKLNKLIKETKQFISQANRLPIFGNSLTLKSHFAYPSIFPVINRL